MVEDVSDVDFRQAVLLSDKPVVVDFWAPWCGPCRQMAPIFAEVAEVVGDKAKFVKVDVDTSSVGMQFGIRSLPTFLVFKHGNVVGSSHGFRPKHNFQQWVDEILNP